MKHKDITRNSQPVFVPKVISLAKAAEILGLSDADLDKNIEDNHIAVYCNPIQHTTNVVVRGMSFPRKEPGYYCTPYLSSRLDGSANFHKSGEKMFLDLEAMEHCKILVTDQGAPFVSAAPTPPVTPDETGTPSATRPKDASADTASPSRKPPKSEVTQEEAADLAGVKTVRTISNWDKGIGTPNGYPGRQSRAAFMAFIERRESDKRSRKAARAMNKARPGGDMNEFSEQQTWE